MTPTTENADNQRVTVRFEYEFEYEVSEYSNHTDADFETMAFETLQANLGDLGQGTVNRYHPMPDDDPDDDSFRRYEVTVTGQRNINRFPMYIDYIGADCEPGGESQADTDDSQIYEVTVNGTDRINYVTNSIEAVDGDFTVIKRNDP